MNYLVIAKQGGESYITFTVNCRTTNNAISKAMKYCNDEGYFIREIKVVEMFNGHTPIDLGGEETFWLQVERFNMNIGGYKLYEYEVPIDWLSEHVNNIKEFIEDYVADETTGLYDTAKRDDVVINERWVET